VQHNNNHCLCCQHASDSQDCHCVGYPAVLQYAAAYAAGAVLFKSTDPAYAANLYAHAKQAFAFAEAYKSK